MHLKRAFRSCRLSRAYTFQLGSSRAIARSHSRNRLFVAKLSLLRENAVPPPRIARPLARGGLSETRVLRRSYNLQTRRNFLSFVLRLSFHLHTRSHPPRWLLNPFDANPPAGSMAELPSALGFPSKSPLVTRSITTLISLGYSMEKRQ